MNLLNVSGALAGLVFAIGLSAPAVSSAETKLIVGSYLPAQHVAHRAGLKPFFERVEKQTDGSLKFDLFVGGAMGGAKESLASIKDGVVDSAIVVDVYLKADLPAGVAFADLQALADDPLVFAAATTETQLLACPQCAAEQKRHNIKNFAFYSTSTYLLMCKDPVKTLAEFRTKKIRASSRMGALSKKLGATPVSITTAEMYEAMQRGQADCTLGSVAWLKSYNLKDIVKSVLDIPLGAFFGVNVFNMNQDRWDSLSSKERDVIINNAPKLLADIVYEYVAEGESALAAAVANGAKKFKPEADFIAEVKKFRAGEVEAAVAKAEKAGVKDAKGMLDVFMTKVAKWRKIVAATGGDQKKYEEALRTEIYAKLKH